MTMTENSKPPASPQAPCRDDLVRYLKSSEAAEMVEAIRRADSRGRALMTLMMVYARGHGAGYETGIRHACEAVEMEGA